MTGIKRLHCHSAFKHYNMFHCNRSSGYGNSVFNTTYNFNGGTMCGGGFWGGLLGGLGMSLGAGIMNFLGGGLGNMYGSPASFFGMGGNGLFGGGGCFGGGFPMMNMFGGGGMFGGGFPMSNWFGGNSALSNWFGLGGKDKTSSTGSNKNADREPINKLETRVKTLESQYKNDKTKVKSEDVDELLKDIKDYTPNDGVADDKDQEKLDKLKARVEALKNGASSPAATTRGASPSATMASPDVKPAAPTAVPAEESHANKFSSANSIPALIGLLDDKKADNLPDGDKTAFNNKFKTLLPHAPLQELETLVKDAKFKKLTPAQQKAVNDKIKALKAAAKPGQEKKEIPGIKQVDNTNVYQPTKPLSDETIIALSEEKAKRVLRLATHNMDELEDKYIKGTIGNVTKDNNDKVTSYEIDCKSNGEFKLKYRVTPLAKGKSKIECIEDTTGNYYTMKNGIVYDNNLKSGMLENKTKYALVISQKIYNSLSASDKEKYKKVAEQ